MSKEIKQTSLKEDRRLRMVDRTMRIYGNEPHALIETLHAVQESYGFIDTDLMQYVAEKLGVPLSKVYGVATFYHFFTLKPQGEHTCVVCTGTACYISGAKAIMDDFAKKYDLLPGETTKDNKLSLLTARCLGACGLAPAIVFDGVVAGKQTPETVSNTIERWFKNEL
ncbi:MAG TPA: bidirectional hydrogenase complex protein HoxE [Nitrospirae bacterium]|nr:bidirectional hydrogenase complex protein HoxE [Nitrospirota bacterium]